MDTTEAFEAVKREIQGECLADVSEDTGVSASTLRNWRDNKVKYPRLSTFMKIASYYGYEVSVTKRTSLALRGVTGVGVTAHVGH